MIDVNYNQMNALFKLVAGEVHLYTRPGDILVCRPRNNNLVLVWNRSFEQWEQETPLESWRER